MNALDHLLLRRYRESVASNHPRGDLERDLGEALASLAAEQTSAQASEPSSTDNAEEQEPHINLVHEAFAGLLGQSIDADEIGVTFDVDEEVTSREDADFVNEPDESPREDANKITEQPISEDPVEEPRMPFKPDWEVDHFLWPSICENVEERLESELATVLETIQSECQLHLCNVVAVASTDAGSGSTTMALCLAREAARQGLSVALIDLHHARPVVAERLGVACEQGVESLPLESVGPENICIAAVEDGVSLLPLTRPVDSTFCGSSNIQELINNVATQYDLVLVDTSSEVIEVMVKQNQCRGFGVIWVSPAEAEQDETASISLPITMPLSNQRDDFWTVGVIRNQAA